MLFIVAAILLAALILRCVDASGLSEIGKLLVILLVIVLLGGITIGSPETAHYFSLR